jgi:BASS family bile acid:Na+ symporter
MVARRHGFSSGWRILDTYFFRFLIGSYVVAAVWPAPGLWMRDQAFGSITLVHESTKVSLPLLMLAAILFNAGLGMSLSQLRTLIGRPAVLLAGLAANLLIPIAFIFGVTQLMRLWHNPDEVQSILVGLALVASMPIAGSSTAWSQNSDGDLALSLGLVLGSTLISPATTPLALHAVGLLATGGYAEALHGLASGGTGSFLVAGVIVPSLLGIAVRSVAGEQRIAVVKPSLKRVNALLLLALNYSNAAVSLPQAVFQPDGDFLSVLLAITVGLCALTFTAGWLCARVLGVGRGQRAALMFGLGMNNNGTGLVLASMSFAQYPRVMLPIIFYNLVQHLVAGAVSAWFFPGPASEPERRGGHSPYSGSSALRSSGTNRPSIRIGTPSKAMVPPP